MEHVATFAKNDGAVVTKASTSHASLFQRYGLIAYIQELMNLQRQDKITGAPIAQSLPTTETAEQESRKRPTPIITAKDGGKEEEEISKKPHNQ